MRSILFALLVCFGITHDTRATTWDEPWHDEVIRGSDSFVKVKITADQGSVIKAEVVKFLAGERTAQQIELRGYWRLMLGSVSADTSELRSPFVAGQIYYVFIKKSEKGNSYRIPTPTSGWATMQGEEVAWRKSG